MGSDEVQREALRRFLTQHQPIDEQERVSLAAFIEQLDQLDRPFAEDGGLVHVTSSAIVVGARGVILHKHKRLGSWIQPGGHIDEGEHPADAAVREVLEETGLTTTHFSGSPTIVHIDVHAAPKGHTHLDLRYLLHGPDADPQPPEGESPDVAWLSFEDALAMAGGGLAGMMAAGQRFCERHGFVEIPRTDGGGNLRYGWSASADRDAGELCSLPGWVAPPSLPRTQGEPS